MRSHMWLYRAYWPSGDSGGAWRGWMVSYNKPLSSTSSSLSSSRWFPILPALQLPPTSSLPAFLAAIFNAAWATNRRHSSPRLWLFYPQQVLPSFPSLPFAFLLIIIIGTWLFFYFIWWCEEGNWAASPSGESKKQRLWVAPSTHNTDSPITLCVCRGLPLCIFCVNSWLIINYGWC